MGRVPLHERICSVQVNKIMVSIKDCAFNWLEEKSWNEPECSSRAASLNAHCDVTFHFAFFRGTNKLWVHREKKKVLLAIMKVIFFLFLLTFFLSLAYLTLPGRQDGKSYHYCVLFLFMLSFFVAHWNFNPTI